MPPVNFFIKRILRLIFQNRRYVPLVTYGNGVGSTIAAATGAAHETAPDTASRKPILRRVSAAPRSLA
jgi:hypothetical protein